MLENLLPRQYMHCSEQERVAVSICTLRHRDTSQVNMEETKYLWTGLLMYKGAFEEFSSRKAPQGFVYHNPDALNWGTAGTTVSSFGM
jgi:hypothetical protein